MRTLARTHASKLLGCLLAAAGCSGEAVVAPGAPPQSLQYAPDTLVGTVGKPLSSGLPTQTGGTIVAYAVAPALPAGIALTSETGLISGTPEAVSAETAYTITGTNTFGAATATLRITIESGAPAGLAYAPADVTLTLGEEASIAAPTSTGGAIAGCTVSPALPTGLVLDTATCAISGTPSSPTAAATYTMTATNTGGSATATLTITVKDHAPGSLGFASSEATLTRGVAASIAAPTATGGAITLCTAEPALPTGLTIAPESCAISGTPTTIQPRATYTITASNSGGSTTAVLGITVNDAAPASLAYSPATLVMTKGVTLGSITPTHAGGEVVGCAVSPALPAGLVLDPVTCAISGTPTALATAATYTISATNTGGSASTEVSITVNDVAPSSLAYTPAELVGTRGVAVSMVPTLGGGPVVACSVNPALPSGLSLNPSTCAITGVPTTTSAARTFVVTALNSGGSTSADVRLTINDLPPTELAFTPSARSATLGVPFAATPTSGGGAITSCFINPALPAGLQLDPATCTITGAATALSPTADYTITAANSGGSVTASLTLTVKDVPPSDVTFTPSARVATLGTAFTATPTIGGGAIVTCTTTPSLPAGLQINGQTCAISGTPTALTGSVTYTITATNSGGSNGAVFQLKINDVAPSSLVYSPAVLTITKGIAMTRVEPTRSGGALVGCSIDPGLPAGLSFDATNCAVSGTATTLFSRLTYTATAVNSGGSTTGTFTLAVVDVRPGTLAYPGARTTYQVGVAITALTPSITGGGSVTGYAVEPALPAGLVIDPVTGIISGTPTAVTATGNYVVSASNTGGAATVTLPFTIIAASSSCLAVPLAARTGDGLYLIDVDGAGALQPFQAYCDMTTDDGGWTLVARAHDGATALHRDRAAVGVLTSPAQTTTAKLSDVVINLLRGTTYANSVLRMQTADGKRDYFVDSKSFDAIGNTVSVNRVFDTWATAQARTAGCDGQYNAGYHTGLVGWTCYDYMIYADNPGMRSQNVYQAGAVFVRTLP